MPQALVLWGYEISAVSAFQLIAAYIFISLLLIVTIPWLAVREGEKATLDEKSKIIDMRSKIRSSIIQIVGGISVVAAFIVSMQQIRQSEDAFKEKKADLYAKSIAILLDAKSQLTSRAEAMSLLSYVSRSDPTYHRSVFDSLSAHIRGLSQAACQNEVSKTVTWKPNDQIQIAIRIIGERNPDHDPSGKRFNLEHACLTEVDLRDEWSVVRGLRGVRLSNARMHRADFTKADLSGAELIAVQANDYENLSSWTPTKGHSLHPGEQGELRNASSHANGSVRRALIVHFIDANLTNTNFSDAQLTGADFSGADLSGTIFNNANISRANFNGAQNLKQEQLQRACVGRSNMSSAELKLEQPFLWKELREKLAPAGIRACP